MTSGSGGMNPVLAARPCPGRRARSVIAWISGWIRVDAWGP